MKMLIEFFYHWEKQTPNNVFMCQPQGENWHNITWQQAGKQIRSMAQALQSHNFAPQTPIGLLSKNCYHWVLADLAIQMAQLVSVPFYPNLSPIQLQEVIEQSNIALLFVGKLDEWDKFLPHIPQDLPIVKFPHYKGNALVDTGKEWDTIVNNFEPLQHNPVPEAQQLWTVLFTSGTTGTPKGVMLEHGAFAKLIDAEMQYKTLGIMAMKQARFFSFLPLNHIAERMAVETGALMSGGTIYFAESVDSFAKNLQYAKPHLFLAVPRIWSKFQLAILEKMPNKRLDILLKIPFVGNKVKQKIRKALGLDEAKIVLTGAAATPQVLKNWYQKLGIELQEVYGMTETCGGCVVMPKGVQKNNSTGKIIEGVMLKIDESSGEIIVKMPWQMSGYYNAPQQTQQVMKDGWIHTGDKGYLDSEGFLFITGRIADSFKTSKGKFILPLPIEQDFAQNELIEQICVVGLGIDQPIALCSLSQIGLKQNKTEIKQRLLANLNDYNHQKPNYEKLSTIIVIKDEWTVDNQILTPTMKVKRNKIDEIYAPNYSNWHQDKETIIWQDK